MLCFWILFQRDLAAIERKVSDTCAEGSELSDRYPQVRDSLSERLEEVELSWESLRRKASARREILSQAVTAHMYFSDWRELTYVSLSVCLSPHYQRAY